MQIELMVAFNVFGDSRSEFVELCILPFCRFFFRTGGKVIIPTPGACFYIWHATPVQNGTSAECKESRGNSCLVFVTPVILKYWPVRLNRVWLGLEIWKLLSYNVCLFAPVPLLLWFFGIISYCMERGKYSCRFYLHDEQLDCLLLEKHYHVFLMDIFCWYSMLFFLLRNGFFGWNF